MFKSEVFKAWTLVLQIGIAILVPVFLLVAVAFYIREKFDLDFMLIAIVIGILAGIRNAAILLKNYVSSMESNKSSELLAKHKSRFN